MNWSKTQVARKALLMSGVMLACSSLPSPPADAAKQPAAEAVITTRADGNKLLSEARQAMAAGKLPEANALLRRVENSKVRFPVLNFGDSPSKVRRDLQKLLNKSRAANAKQPAPAAGPRYASGAAGNTATGKPAMGITKLPTVQTPLPTNLAALAKPSLIAGANPLAAPVVKYPSTADFKTTLSVAGQMPATASGQVQLASATETVPLNLSVPNAPLPNVKLAERTSPRVAQVPNGRLTQIPTEQRVVAQPGDALRLLQEGEKALRSGDRNGALRMFLAAHTQRNELDLRSQQQLQDHLQMLSARNIQSSPRSSRGSLLNSASSGQAVLARQLSTEVGKKQTDANRLRKTDPQGALKILQDAGALVASSELESGTKTQLTRRVDLSIAETEKFIRENGAEIELDQANQAALESIDRDREVKHQVQTRLATLVDQYNTLRDEQRYAEMEVVAKRAYDMAPEEAVAQQIWENAKFIRRSMLNREIANASEAGVFDTLAGIRLTSSHALNAQNSDMTFAEDWPDLISGRKSSSELTSRSSVRDLEIRRKLRTPILPRYDDMPLTAVMESLSELAGVNIHLDPRGLGQEGVRTDTAVRLNLSQEISLESALTLILEPLHLTYMIKDEVLKVTSDQIRDGDKTQKVYNVADLVIPIPNFTPSSNMGLQGLINDAYDALPNVQRSSGGPMAYVPGQAGFQGAPGSPNVLQQQFGNNGGPGATSMPMGTGPGGGLGGAAQADFDSLIDLIVSTVEHESWMENGTGEGEIQPFPTNLSLVISQTQRVHEKIADLLDQLRRLQDLQVTIEVRFIRLTDSFFERIGIDFDFNIEDGTGAAFAGINTVGATFEPGRQSGTVGVTGESTGIGDPLPDFSVDLDIPFRNSSFGLTVPQFGTPAPIGQFGFAILSDIEAFFLIEASQGDQRANVLQAPKVTLFNGQQAIIVDTAFTPFVISVIPVVGEFAAAQQPVIVVLSEGTMMTVQAVVSDDRRYVRLTLVPFFSQIGEVRTFTFEGSETTSTSSDTTDNDDDGNNESDDNSNQVTRSGTTVQLPTFEVITVATTVSVPDGGTVLLGGIKRLREGRNEFGVPLLSKLPYVDRLFRNVGIGRETDSLMMMVTPHIIIQEEEEERLGFTSN